MRCSTCGHELERKADPAPHADPDSDRLLCGHCRFCRLACDMADFVEARAGGDGVPLKFDGWQLKLLSEWLRLKDAQL